MPSSLQLSCRLVGSKGEALYPAPSETSLTLDAGKHWITRDLLLNLPPGSEMGGTYSGVWEARIQGAIVAASTRTLALTVLPPLPVRIPILMYHRVLPQGGFITIGLDDFRGQMRVLKAYGYTSVTFDDLMAYRAGLKTPPAKPVLLTADDGNSSWLTYVHPILSDPSLDYRMTGFIETGMLDISKRDYPAEDPYMDWLQAAELEATADFDLESHTVLHPHLPQVDDARAWQEISQSKARTESQLGKEARFLAYPYGDYSPRDQRLAWEAGYQAAVTDSGGVEQDCYDKWDLDRIGIYTDTVLTYDATKPWTFFATVIRDPDVSVPILQVASVKVTQGLTTGTLKGMAEPGTTVSLNLSVHNNGQSAWTSATLLVYPDGLTSASMGNRGFDLSGEASETVEVKKGKNLLRWSWAIPKGGGGRGLYGGSGVSGSIWSIGFSSPGFAFDPEGGAEAGSRQLGVVWRGGACRLEGMIAAFRLRAPNEGKDIPKDQPQGLVGIVSL